MTQLLTVFKSSVIRAKISELLKIIIVIFTLASCNNQMKQQEPILKAHMDTPMGSNDLSIFKDYTFQFENKRLLKNTIYKGKVKLDGDTLRFEYSDITPDFGDTAVIDGIFLTYTNGIYRELLEISVNKLSE